MRLIWCVFVFTLFGAANFATVAVAEDSAVEYITVSGVVKDSMGELVNAHVYLKSNNRVGDVTDNDGWFELQVPKGDTLVVSYLGYESQNLTELHEDMDIELKQSAETLDAVEVVWERACSISDVPNSVEREKDEESGKCVAISCVDGYEVQNGKCVEETVDQVVGEETVDEIDEVVEDTENNNTESEEELTNEPQPAKVAETDTESVKEAQEKKVAELQENYENMKEIENSFENRMLGATGMATMGIGGMQLAT
ncbi:MAG: carboxypeptidase-like regulatory domain-containing protein, partial [Alphaproteobacteria bacterium]|nr:carboxypeptidase-like regulatory domain-containing protein [Alphaproteobacteria bacterium]